MLAREKQLLDEEARRLLGLYEKEQYASLLTEVDELSKRGPLSPGVLGVASLALTALDRYDEAIKAASHATRQEPGWAWLHGALAAAEAGQGRQGLERALAAQRQAVQLMPGEPAYAAVLARYLREAGQTAEAARTARLALMLDPAHPGALNELGLALQATGDGAGALQAFKQAHAADPTAPEAFINEGVLHLRGGARKEARKALREALRRSPGLPEAENRMAETLAGERGSGRAVLLHLLTLGRITVVGWLMIAFLYYVSFRLLQILWNYVPATLPAARGLLLVTLTWLLGGLTVGHLLRLAFRTGWPR
jgi:tetratricopeptide (TPR) repeat protein